MLTPAPAGGTTICVGNGSAVTITTGLPLYAGGAPQFISLPVTSPAATLWAIAASTGQVLGTAFISRS